MRWRALRAAPVGFINKAVYVFRELLYFSPIAYGFIGHKTTHMTHVLCARTALVLRTQDNPDAPAAREGATCDECDANCTVTEDDCV